MKRYKQATKSEGGLEIFNIGLYLAVSAKHGFQKERTQRDVKKRDVGRTWVTQEVRGIKTKPK